MPNLPFEELRGYFVLPQCATVFFVAALQFISPGFRFLSKIFSGRDPQGSPRVLDPRHGIDGKHGV